MTTRIAVAVDQVAVVVVTPVVLGLVMKIAPMCALMVAPELVKVIPEAGNSLI